MKSITIHGLSDALDRLIRKKAAQQNTSQNKVIKQLLEESLGLKKENITDHSKEFEDLCGVWTQKDAREFNAALADFEEIDSRDWK